MRENFKWLVWAFAASSSLWVLAPLFMRPITTVLASTPAPTVVTTAIYSDRVCVVLLKHDADLITKCTSTMATNAPADPSS